MDSVDPAELRRWDLAQELPATPAPTGQVLSIDVEKARAVIARLDELALTVWTLSKDLSLGRVVAPGEDEVSRNIATQGDLLLRSSRDYLMAWYGDLTRGAAALQGQVEAYTEQDRQAGPRA